MERKQIKINPDFFSLSKRRRRKDGAKKPLFKHSLKTKDIKKTEEALKGYQNSVHI